MKKLVLTVASVASVALFSNLAFAESHGGVGANNTQMAAVVAYATSAGGTLSRVLKIEKNLESGLFEISYGNMDSEGVESINDKQIVRVKIVESEDSVYGAGVVEHVSGTNMGN